MNITITPFDRDRHIDVAADLLAGRHRRDRTREQLLPATFDDPKTCRAQIEHAFESDGWYGVAAEAGGETVGFAIMTPQHIPATHFLASFFPTRGASLGYAAFAAKDGMEHDVLRAMFSELADYFVARGIFEFSVSVPASDPVTQEAFVSLGFGRNLTCAIRDVAPPGRASAAGIELHQAGAEDAEVIFDLNEELTLHHARSPIFNPYIRESDQASHDFQRGLLNDPAANAHWVGYEDGRPIGMNTFMQPFFLSPLTIPEKTIYLFQGIVTQDVRAGGVGTAILSRSVAWAREQGYEHVALHFASANLSGAKFWQSSGFRPVEHGMRRRVDERIAWANK
ncbi:MAG: GNAT family N-acetyltransferase [Dehalococcoidia bacterium]|nr:MAG: GNAT family N-acetyltransferase [Dehalococcoidia bacterium]